LFELQVWLTQIKIFPQEHIHKRPSTRSRTAAAPNKEPLAKERPRNQDLAQELAVGKFGAAGLVFAS